MAGTMTVVPLALALLVVQGSAADQGIAAYTQQNYAEARRLLEPLADNGDGKAQYYIGLMYQRGVGYPRNYVRAHMWFNLSGARGVNQASAARDEVERLMTPQQRAEAERLAVDWRPASAAPPPGPSPAPAPPPTTPRTPSRGPGSATPAEGATAAVVSFLSRAVRPGDVDETAPTIEIADCMLKTEHEFRVSSRTTIVVTNTVEVGRIRSVRRYDSVSSGLHVSLHAMSSSDVSHTRSSGRNRTSGVLLIPVRSGFDFTAFEPLVMRAKETCSR